MRKVISVLMILSLLMTSVISISAATTSSNPNLKIVSYNVYVAQLPTDPVNKFSLRAPRMAQVLNAYHPDSMGLQECSVEWMTFLNSNLPDYAYVGVGRENGTNDANSGEASPIFYLKDKFNLIGSGTFWLSQTPDIPSYGWGADYKRVCTYAVLQNKTTSEKYLHVNTHLDFMEEPQVNSVKLIKNKIDQLRVEYANIPVVITGDFNLDRTAPAYAEMVNGTYSTDMEDTLYCTPQDKIYNEGGTLPGISNPYTPEGQLEIDHIFISIDQFNSRTYKVMRDTVDGHRVSDHYGICVELDYGPGQLVRFKDNLYTPDNPPVNYAVKGTATVDGLMDSAYSNAESITVNKKYYGTAGTNGTAKIIYDDNYLYYFIDVNDNNVTADGTNPVSGEETYGIDGVQVFFDFLNAELYGITYAYQQNESGYINTYANGTKAIDKSATCPSGVFYAARRKTGGYTVEAKVVLSQSLKNRLAIEEDIVIGIGIQINDDENNDGKREGIYINYNKVVEAWSDPAKLSDLVLKTGVDKSYRFTPGTPDSIDGFKDKIYNASQTIDINRDGQDNIVTGMAYAQVNTVYDSEYIYCFAEVTDPTTNIEGTRPKDTNYGIDGVQVFFDYGDKYGYVITDLTGTENLRQDNVAIVRCHGDFSSYNGDSAKMVYKAVRTGKGYNIELKFALSDGLKQKIRIGDPGILIGAGFQLQDDQNNLGIRERVAFSKGSINSAWAGRQYYAKGVFENRQNIKISGDNDPSLLGHLAAVGTPQTIDGVMDNVYMTSEVQRINRNSSDGIVSGCATGTARVVYDNEYIYSYIAVNDTTPSASGTPAAEPYGKDGIQIYFNLGGTDYGFNTINVNGVSEVKWNTDRFTYVWLPVTNGYVVECKLKINDTLKSRIANGEKNIVIGSGFQINDDTNNDGTRDRDIYSKGIVSGAWSDKDKMDKSVLLGTVQHLLIFGTPLAIDGDYDSIYDSAEVIKIDKNSSEGVVTGCATGIARTIYDSDYLYSFIEVKDSTPSSVNTTAANNYGKDSVQIYFGLGGTDYGYNTINVNGVTVATWGSDRFAYKWIPVKNASGVQTGYIIECRLKMNDALKTRIANGESSIVISTGFQINDDTNNDGTRDRDIYSKGLLVNAWSQGIQAYEESRLRGVQVGGTVSVRNTASVGGVVPFKVTPRAGYKVGSIKLNGRMIKGSSFAMPDSDVILEVSFI